MSTYLEVEGAGFPTPRLPLFQPPVSTCEQTERGRNAYYGAHLLKWRPEMTTPVVSSTAMLFSATSDESGAPVTRAYRTETSFVAVYFPQPGRGQIVFLPEGAILRVLRPSSCLPEGLEVMFENRIYNVFDASDAALKPKATITGFPLAMLV